MTCHVNKSDTRKSRLEQQYKKIHKELLPENKGCCSKANTINCLQSMSCLNHSWDISLESQRWIKKHWPCENFQSFTLFSLILWDEVLQSTFFLCCNWHRPKQWALKDSSCAISLRTIFRVIMINIIYFLFTLLFRLRFSHISLLVASCDHNGNTFSRENCQLKLLLI